jgi:hypothetical protein
MPSLPPVDLTQSGWQIYEGQAVWKRDRQAPEIAGEMTVGVRDDADYFVQFSKGPFPLLTAQVAHGGWELVLPAENKRYSGHGQPPARLAILSLPRALSTGAVPKGWSWQKLETNGWRLENRGRGEYLEGYLALTRPSAL